MPKAWKVLTVTVPPLANPFGQPRLQLLPDVLVESHYQDLVGLRDPGFDGVRDLGHDGRSLAGTRCRDEEVAILKDDDRPLLLLRERLALDSIEEVSASLQLASHEALVPGSKNRLRVIGERRDAVSKLVWHRGRTEVRMGGIGDELDEDHLGSPAADPAQGKDVLVDAVA